MQRMRSDSHVLRPNLKICGLTSAEGKPSLAEASALALPIPLPSAA